MKQKHRLISYLILGFILLVLAVFAYFYWPSLKQFTSPSYIREYLFGLGIWGYLMFAFLLFLSVPLPIPSMPVAVLGGYLYGAFWGTILGLIAMILGSIVSFYLVRIYGLPLLEKLVDKHHIVHFSRVLQKRGNVGILISYAIPIFPEDALSLILGLTNIKFLTFLVLVIFGNIPRFILLNSLGDDLSVGLSWRTAFVFLLAIVFLLIAIFRKPIKRLLFKEIRSLEKESEKEIVVVETKTRKEIRLVEKKLKKKIKSEIITIEKEFKKKPKIKTKIPSK